MMNVTSQSCRRSQLAKLTILALQFSLLLGAEKFYADDPLEAMPAPLAVEKLETRKLNDVYDLFENWSEKIGDCHKRPVTSPSLSVKLLAAAGCPQHFFTPSSFLFPGRDVREQI